MVDTPTTRNRLRKQEVGTNNNTWGTKLNEVLDCVDQIVDGVESINLGGVATYTLTTSDYTTADEAKNRVLIISNVNAAGSDVVVPSVEHTYGVRNIGSATIEVRTAAGTGVEIPAGRFAWVYCDGTNVVSAATTTLPASFLPSYLTDPVTVDYLNTALAGAAIPGSPGTVKVDAAAASVYLIDALVASGALTITDNGDSLTLGVGALGLADGGTISSASAVAVNTKYLCDFTSTSYTITLPAAPDEGDMVLITKFGTNVMTIDLNGLKFNGATSNPVSGGEGSTLLRYTGTSRGWVEM